MATRRARWAGARFHCCCWWDGVGLCLLLIPESACQQKATKAQTQRQAGGALQNSFQRCKRVPIKTAPQPLFSRTASRCITSTTTPHSTPLAKTTKSQKCHEKLTANAHLSSSCPATPHSVLIIKASHTACGIPVQKTTTTKAQKRREQLAAEQARAVCLHLLCTQCHTVCTCRRPPRHRSAVRSWRPSRRSSAPHSSLQPRALQNTLQPL